MKCLWVTFCHAPGATTGLIWGIGEGKSKDTYCTKYSSSALICSFESNLCSYFGRSCECSGNHTNPLNPESTCRCHLCCSHLFVSFSPDLPTRHQVLRSALVVVLVSAAGALVTRLRPSPGNSASAMTRLVTGKTFKCFFGFFFSFHIWLLARLTAGTSVFWGFQNSILTSLTISQIAIWGVVQW